VVAIEDSGSVEASSIGVVAANRERPIKRGKEGGKEKRREQIQTKGSVTRVCAKQLICKRRPKPYERGEFARQKRGRGYLIKRPSKGKGSSVKEQSVTDRDCWCKSD